MEWESYWEQLICEKKLQDKVNNMDVIDRERDGKTRIKDICHDIYNDYDNYCEELEKIRMDLLKMVETFPGVHLQTSRVKQLDSLLEKVITKRHQHLLDAENLYSIIDVDNYKDILTDLIGIRLIISYRGKWKDIHESILQRFPYSSDKNIYVDGKFVPHPSDGAGIMAEIPKAYYAYGDDVTMYKKAGIRVSLKENGYRSIHYVISFQKTYVEIQIRTIYDEAWSDCDHSYVYKHEDNLSYSALKELSEVLCMLTNVSNDLGEEMREIYESVLICEMDGNYKTKESVILQINRLSDRIKVTQQKLEQFRKRLT